jgi:pimeloyl-ACP methyl ester carboxylesterase
MRQKRTIKRVGHAPFLEEPARFNTELKHFAENAYH